METGAWDRVILPLPFARAQFVLEGPLNLPAGAEGALLEVVRADWEFRSKPDGSERKACSRRRYIEPVTARWDNRVT